MTSSVLWLTINLRSFVGVGTGIFPFSLYVLRHLSVAGRIYGPRLRGRTQLRENLLPAWTAIHSRTSIDDRTLSLGNYGTLDWLYPF